MCEVFAAPSLLSFVSWSGETGGGTVRRPRGRGWSTAAGHGGARGAARRRVRSRLRWLRGALLSCVCLPGWGNTRGSRGGSRVDGGLRGGRERRSGVGRRATGPGRVGVGRWLPPFLAPSPRVGRHAEVPWVRPRDRVGPSVAGNGGRARVTRAAGLGHAEVGSPRSPRLLGACPESVGDGAGAGVKNLLHHIIGWEQ